MNAKRHQKKQMVFSGLTAVSEKTVKKVCIHRQIQKSNIKMDSIVIAELKFADAVLGTVGKPIEGSAIGFLARKLVGSYV